MQIRSGIICIHDILEQYVRYVICINDGCHSSTAIDTISTDSIFSHSDTIFVRQIRIRGVAAEFDVLFGTQGSSVGIFSLPGSAPGWMCSRFAVQFMEAAIFFCHRLEQGCAVGRRTIAPSGTYIFISYFLNVKFMYFNYI